MAIVIESVAGVCNGLIKRMLVFQSTASETIHSPESSPSLVLANFYHPFL